VATPSPASTTPTDSDTVFPYWVIRTQASLHKVMSGVLRATDIYATFAPVTRSNRLAGPSRRIAWPEEAERGGGAPYSPSCDVWGLLRSQVTEPCSK